MSAIDFSLPLKNPILLFSLILFIILFAPILLNKIKIPHLIGLIMAGAIIGPNGLNLMLRDSSIVLFGTVGLMYIMFLAGLEIDLAEFKRNSLKSIIFGLYTFTIPMGMGIFAGYYVLRFPLPTSILLASMFASHTLLAYPIISKLGIVKNRAVNITVGGTMITDTLALLVLAAVVGTSTGEASSGFWIKLGISIVVFSLIVLLGFPIIGRWFFKTFDDGVSQYIFVLATVFMGAFLAEAAGVEGIIGAFLAGLALNRLIPHTSPLMNRIEFVGNALFIPFFLIGVGMLVDYRAFFKDLETILVAVVMIIVATSAKYIAAWLAQKTFRFTNDERWVIFGLSNAQAAATLAAVLVGYNIVLNQAQIDSAAKVGEIIEPVRLLSESVLNGTILMILVTCTIASFAAQKGAEKIALAEMQGQSKVSEKENLENIMVVLPNLEITEEMMNLAIIIKSKKSKIFAVNVIEDDSSVSQKKGEKILEKAVSVSSATDNKIIESLVRDTNITTGILENIREHAITDLILGVYDKKGISNAYLRDINDNVLNKNNSTTLIYKSSQPISTVKRHLVIIPENADKEVGFRLWLNKIFNITRNTGSKIVFYAPSQCLQSIKEAQEKNPVAAEFVEFSEWGDFLILSRDVRNDDTLCVVMSRKGKLSYNSNMSKIPDYLNKYFQTNNFILIYPTQLGVLERINTEFASSSLI